MTKKQIIAEIRANKLVINNEFLLFNQKDIEIAKERLNNLAKVIN